MGASLPSRPCLRPWNCRRIAILMVAGLLTTGNEIVTAAPTPAAQPRPTEVSIAVLDLIQEASRRFAVPARWIAEVMQIESRGGAGAVSPKGAIGLMQVMPSTYANLAARYGLGADPWNPRDNVLAGAAYLREMYDRYGATGMLAAYNAGPGRWNDHLSGKRPLPDETLRYIARLGPVVGGTVAPLPAFIEIAVRPMPIIAPIFAALGDATTVRQSAAERQRIARIIVANATVIRRPAEFFVQRSAEMDEPSGELQAGGRAAGGTHLDRAPSDASVALVPASSWLFARRTGVGERP